MKTCSNCGTTLEDNENYCVICEQYQNVERKIKYQEELKYKNDTTKKTGRPQFAKMLSAIGCRVMVVAVIASLVAMKNRGTPEGIVDEYMTAICNYDASALVDCLAVPKGEEGYVYSGYQALFILSSDLFGEAKSYEYQVDDIKSLSAKEQLQFWSEYNSKDILVSSSDIGAMAKASVVLYETDSTGQKVLRFDVYVGIYKGKWKVVLGKNFE